MAAKCARCRGVGYCDHRENHWGVCPDCGGRGMEPTRRTYSPEFHKWTWFFDDGVLNVARERFGDTPEARAAAGLPDPLSAGAAAFVNRSDATVRVRIVDEPGLLRAALDVEKRVRPTEPTPRADAVIGIASGEASCMGAGVRVWLTAGQSIEAMKERAAAALLSEYRRLAAGDRNRVVEHEPRLSPTELAALGGNRTIGRDSLGWDYDPDGVP